MAIDIRAEVTCSLGPLIGGSISDDYVQEQGLVLCQGSCELNGIFTPAVGTRVNFWYTRNGITRQVPRTLRVMSSFADPFRRITTVELGCKLKYLEDLREEIDWTAFDDEANAGMTQADAQIITIPITAQSVMNKCLQELGITASHNPLTNRFSIEKYDLSPGYVQILSELLVSECYCGYLDASETLVVFSLDASNSSGPVISSSKIIDVAPIGVGKLPGEAVTVSYSNLKLNVGIEDPNTADWDTATTSNQHTVNIPYTDSAGVQHFKTYKVLDKSLVSTTYQQIIKPNGEVVKVPQSRRSIETTGSVMVVGSLVTDYLKNGMPYNNEEITKDTSEFFYYDEWGNETLYIRDTVGSQAHLAGDLGIQRWVFTPGSDYVVLDTATNRSIEYVVRQTYTVGEFQRVITETFGAWTRTIAGQQAIASGALDLTTSTQVYDLLATLFPENGGMGNRGLFSLGVEVSTSRRTEGQIAPDGSSLINAANANGGDPSNGYRTESRSELELALGSATAQRRIEFTLPKAPDDVFTRSGVAPNYTYSSEASDAAEKARRYGRVQNRLLLGNRNGMNIQTLPELLPAPPFAPFIVQASNLAVLYRVNGTNWQMSADGILVSTDALYWGVLGGSSETTWVPVAPGITTLPAAPTIVDTSPTVVIGAVADVGINPQITLAAAFPDATSGQGVQDQATDQFWVYDGSSWQNAGTTPGPTVSDDVSVVPVWNETVLVESRLRVGVVVSSLSYPLLLETDPGPLKASIGLKAIRNTVIYPPSGSVMVTGEIPAVLSNVIPPFVMTGTATPLLGSTAATDTSGWTTLFSGALDDSYTTLDLGFSFVLANTSYTACSVGSNGYITFGGNSVAYTSLSASQPNLPKIMFAPGDRSYRKVYYKTATHRGTTYGAIRWEGYSAGSVSATANTFVEVILFSLRDSNQYVEVRFGNNVATSALFMIASSTTAYATGTSTANSSWVFTGNSTGTSWSLQSGVHIL